MRSHDSSRQWTFELVEEYGEYEEQGAQQKSRSLEQPDHMERNLNVRDPHLGCSCFVFEKSPAVRFFVAIEKKMLPLFPI